MNDNELITAVRESVADVHTTTPVEQILSRGRAVRARRRIRSLAAALAAAAGGGSCRDRAAGQIIRPPPARRPADGLDGSQAARGDVAVTIRELYYPAGLQRKLRADGVPASVTFDAARNYPSWCRAYPRPGLATQGLPAGSGGAPLAAVVIRPSALPTGTGVYLNDSSNPYGYIGLETGLVYASKRCTGS